METRSENGLRELLVDQLRDLYSAETQLIKALPKMSKAATSQELKNAFNDHFQVTQVHANRLEQILQELNEKPTGKKCMGMHGLVEEGEEGIKKKEEDKRIKDAELIAAAQRVEHYEIAGYGTVRTFAEILGLEEAAELLQQTLEEEGEADKLLTSISEKLLQEDEFSGSKDSIREIEEDPAEEVPPEAMREGEEDE